MYTQFLSKTIDRYCAYEYKMALHHKKTAVIHFSCFCVNLFKNILDEQKVQIFQISTDLASWSQTEYEHEHIPQTVQRITQWNCRHDQGGGHRQNWPRAPAWLTENTSGWGWGTVYIPFIVLENKNVTIFFEAWLIFG